MAETPSRLGEGRFDSHSLIQQCAQPASQRAGMGVQNEGNVFLSPGVQLSDQPKSRSLIAVNFGKEIYHICAKHFI